ncbi:MAG: AAA family ATPase [Clostridia bacterium]|nr:AAA family ATPase [Clostridia bacterium]
MKFAIYGVSRSGKDYFIEKLKKYFEENGISLKHIRGSKTLYDMALEKFESKFNQLEDKQKAYLRNEFTKRVEEEEKKHGYVVVDGHHSFYDVNNELQSVFSKDDIKCYDKFFYLDTDTANIMEYMRSSVGEKRNEAITEPMVDAWKDYEINDMTKRLLKKNKELHIIKGDDFALEYIFDEVTKGKYDSEKIAKELLNNAHIPNNVTAVILTDCDKTLSIEDTTSMALSYLGEDEATIKNIFNGDRYTGYQLKVADNYYKSINLYNESVIEHICENVHLNQAIIDDLKAKRDTVILAITASNTQVWKRILEKGGLNAAVLEGDGVISKYVKYYVAKILMERGKFVVSIGDSMLDSLMLTNSNMGYIATQKGYRKNIDELATNNPTLRQLGYFEYKYPQIEVDNSILSIRTVKVTEEIEKNIEICKSTSGIRGKSLRSAHNALGKRVAEAIRKDYPKERFVIVIMLRSGVPFGLGMADLLDCPVLFYDENNIEGFKKQLAENEGLLSGKIILCDAVINTGKSIKKAIQVLKHSSVIIATNVLSSKYDTNSLIPIYATRISENSYEGAKQSNIENGKGPDTSDRLFRLI